MTLATLAVSDEHKCPLCGGRAERGAESDGVTEIRCPCCGTFDIGKMATLSLNGPDPRLSAWTRQHHDLGERLCFRNGDLTKLQAQLVMPGVLEKQQRLLRWIEKQSTFPGQLVGLASTINWPVAWCAEHREFEYHGRELVRLGLLEESAHETRTFNCDAQIRITTEGWQKLAASEDAIEPDLVFVAMWFDKNGSMDSAWIDGFRTGIENSGYRPHRIDLEPHVERIDMKLLADIRRSRIVVADATGVRPNVYYEAGYAEALGRPVIWTVRQDYKDQKQFDTRQFRHIVWKDPSDLAEQLEDFICGVVGRRKASND